MYCRFFFVSTTQGRMWSNVRYIVASNLQKCAPATTQHLTQEATFPIIQENLQNSTEIEKMGEGK